ncbi:hypothetical protein [Deinococcus wulumuqiensis]|nr:hypothetical protein [Deinococcus wulumuqiensis]
MTCEMCDAPLNGEAALCPACQAEANKLSALDVLSERDDLPTLRRVWSAVHGKDKPRRMEGNLALEYAARPGCRMMDDDHLTVWVIRGGEVAHVQCHNLPLSRPLSVSLCSGDVVLSLHEHNCAGDCQVEARTFFKGASVA